MPPRSTEEKAERKRLMEEKRAARRAAKEQKEKEKDLTKVETKSLEVKQTNTAISSSGDEIDGLRLLDLPEDSLHHIMWFLPSRDIGCLTFTCRYLAQTLIEARVPIVLSRLHRPQEPLLGAVGFVDMCVDQKAAR